MGFLFRWLEPGCFYALPMTLASVAPISAGETTT
jgi:hypothetical protein